MQKRLQAIFRGELLEQEPLSRHTSLKVGGPADLYAIPADVEDLKRLLEVLRKDGIPWYVIGGGYNLLVRDGGFRGCIISLKALHRLERLTGTKVTAEAGATNGAFVRFALEQGLGGIEFAAGIPGTVGGAITMNAGTADGEVLHRLETLTTLRDGVVGIRSRDELDYGYRRLRLEDGEIVLQGVFLLEERDRTVMLQRMEEDAARRRRTQNVGFPNAGSFFKNPEGMQAWRLIDEAGMRGTTVGGAAVSEQHANFIVNRGGATASDILALAEQVKESVFRKTGIALEEEVRIIGSDAEGKTKGSDT